MTRIRFIDAHHHFQDLSASYPWLVAGAPEKLEGDLSAIRRDYLPADYRRDLDAVDLVGSVHVQNGRADAIEETRWLDQLADAQGLPSAIVAYADLAAPDIEATLDAHAVSPRLRGVRQILNWHADPRFCVAARPDLMTDTAWRRGFARLRAHGFSFDLQIYWPQMADALRLAADFPDTLIILNHFGMPIDRSAEGLTSWRRAMATLAEAPNVWVKLSGLGLGHPAWTVEDTVPLLNQTVELFGVARCMFGTNLPVDRLFTSPAQTLLAFEALSRSLSRSTKDALYYRNAETAYRLLK